MTLNEASAKSASLDTSDSAEVVELFVRDVSSPRPRRRVALIGGFQPRKCGIATFTTDIYEQLGAYYPAFAVDLHVVDGANDSHHYPAARSVIRPGEGEDYRATARLINEDAVDAVWLQHEYGIFGGENGELVLDLVDRIAAPLIVTLHTVLSDPAPKQRAILERLIERAKRVMVMSQHAAGLLQRIYQVDAERIVVIDHGAPDRPFGRGEAFREAADLTGRKVLMTFGLLNPGKGLETVISALPAVVAKHPDVVYRIVGATHPNLVAREGEAYRERLIAQAEELGVAENIVWENRFLDVSELLDQLEACDIYLTPYYNLQQSTSGTLSYAVALGKAVISTPYVHACELLADGVGTLVETRSAPAIADAVNALLDDPAALLAMQKGAYARGRGTIWPRFADASAALIDSAILDPRAAQGATLMPLLANPGYSGFLSMCDSTGMFQHSIGIVPDRRHGYCLDDNVRALMMMGVADAISITERVRWSMVFASFIQHAWNPDLGRFRNFMAFDRSWCEDVGSDDSNGRTLWALGHAAIHAPEPGLRAWALDWFNRTVPALAQLESPRAVAFTMLGAVEILRAHPEHAEANGIIERGGILLHALLATARRPDWAWFEAVLAYDNPRLSQALIEAARITGRGEWRSAGLESLAFIAAQQRSSSGKFRAIGSESFHKAFESLPFDQQPLEAWAAIDAVAVAWQETGDPLWIEHAEAAYRWYFGANDRGVVLGDIVSGRCRDGINPQGANENCGAESILAMQLAHYAMQRLAQGPRTCGRIPSGETKLAGQSWNPEPVAASANRVATAANPRPGAAAVSRPGAASVLAYS